MAQITELVGLLLLGEDEAFLGSTFPVSEVHSLYLGASHSIPADRRGELSIMIQHSPGEWGITKVVAVEALTGQPDVVVLQANDGLPPKSGLAAEEAFIWDDVAAAGYPETDIREVEPGKRAPGVRGLAGSVTRKVERGESLGVTAPAYEVSFPIPAGMSGGPVFAMTGGIRRGLIGVCLANVSATSFLSGEIVETIGGQQKLIQETRMVEYGIVANLHRVAGSRIRLVNKRVAELIGFEGASTPKLY